MTERRTTTIAEVVEFLQAAAPVDLAESWDNVGLLLGDAAAPVDRIMTCLTVVDAVVDEAVAEAVQLVVAHHPLPFRPLSRIVASDSTGRRLWRLAGAGCAVYSAHTAFDSAAGGINAAIAERLGLAEVQPLRPAPDGDASVGAGRCGDLKASQDAATFAVAAGRALGAGEVRVVGSSSATVRRVGICCGSGAELFAAAADAGCDAFVTGEASFHACLEAESRGIVLVLVGHYASERFAMETLAERLSEQFPAISCHASRGESDPLWSVDCR